MAGETLALLGMDNKFTVESLIPLRKILSMLNDSTAHSTKLCS